MGCRKHWKKKKTDGRKTLKNEEKEKQRIQGKSNNKNKHPWFYLFYKKLYFARKHSLKKWFIPSHFIYSFYVLQDIWSAVMIHQSSYGFLLVFRPNDLRPEMYINKLGTTTQIFIAMDYFILMSEKYLHFKKRQKNLARKLFSHLVVLTGSMFFENIFRIMCISKI